MNQAEKPDKKPSYQIGREHIGNPKVKPYELLKINLNDLVETFNRKILHTAPLTRNSMLRAYKQGIMDAQYLLMAAEKDLRGEAE